MGILNDESNIVQCMCCGNRDSSLIIRRDGGYVCKCCGVWYKSESTQEEMMARLRCENGYAQLRTYRFNDARDTFENVLVEDPENITALWGVLLARFGVVFIKGFYKNVVEPIFCFQNYDRMKNRYVQSEAEYIKLMELLRDDNELRYDYEKKAKKIDDAIDDFKRYKESTDRDVFICVKISAATVNNPELKGTTEDYEFAMRLYEDLEKRGVNTFFSYVTLKNDVDSDEKIWRNLVKSKKMLLVCSREEYFESPWVKSEWKRWLFLGREKELYICVLNKENESPYDILPHEFENNQIYTAGMYKKLLRDVCEGLTLSPVPRKKREADIAPIKPERERTAPQAKKAEDAKKPAPAAVATEEPKKKDDSVTAKPAKKKRSAVVPLVSAVAVIGIGGAIAFAVGAGNRNVPEVPKTEQSTLGTQSPSVTVPVLKYTVSGESCTITGIGTYTDAKLVIPQYIDGYKVTGIAANAFKNCASITSVEIPYGVLRIESYAFKNCSKLASVTIADSVTDIGHDAFYNCAALQSVKLPENLKSIGNNAFWNCLKLLRIDIPDSVTSIGEGAFADCAGLTSLKLPSGLKNLSANAFANCSGLTSVTFPAGMVSIGGLAFNSCTSLETVDLPDNITSIENSAFGGCIALRSVDMPANLKSIGNSAFSGCTNLGSIKIPNSVTSIGTSAFRGCESLIGIELPNTLEIIRESMLYGCRMLATVKIPDSVSVIGNSAFYGCSRITSIEMPDNLTDIQSKAFYGCMNLTSVTIPNGVEKIESETFYGCTKLESVTMPDSVVTIEAYAFKKCTALSDITISENLKTISLAAFSECSALTGISIPKTMDNIGISAFSDCKKLINIEYYGTMAEWNGIYKGSHWDLNTPVYTVHCTDGTIGKAAQ